MQEFINWLLGSEAGNILIVVVVFCFVMIFGLRFLVQSEEKSRKKRLKRQRLGLERPKYLKKDWD